MAQARVFQRDELKSAAEHLAFDGYHFRCYVRLHRESKIQSPTLHQAVVYSLLLHLRVLLDFFFASPVKDDVCVDHFRRTLSEFRKSFPIQILEPASTDVTDLSENLNKLLAHLTATRWEKPRPTMDAYEKHFDAMNRLIDRFRDALPDDVRAAFLKGWTHWERNHPG